MNQISIRPISNGFLVAVYNEGNNYPTEFYVATKEEMLTTMAKVLGVTEEGEEVNDD